MTIKQAKEILKALDVTLTKKNGEFRVNRHGAHAVHAYYTNDINDAVETGKRLAPINLGTVTIEDDENPLNLPL